MNGSGYKHNAQLQSVLVNNKMGLKNYLRKIKIENLNTSTSVRARLFFQMKLKMWAIRVAFLLALSACAVYVSAFGGSCGPKLYQYFFQHYSLPPKRDYKTNGFLYVSSNGGLNQMRAGICDMVAVARYMNVTLIVPELDKTSFWKDQSEFHDVFDVAHFITSLRDEIEILEQVPHRLKKAVETRTFHSMPPVSWSNMSYYLNTILPRIQEHELLHLNKTDARLANNGIPLEVQRLRCRVNYKALKFNPGIEKLGKKIVNILRKKGQYLALHLRYEMDMLAFSGCTEGCTDQEAEELTKMRYAIPWWKEKAIDSTTKRTAGLCPMTPEETALTLKALGIDQDTLIYIAAGDIYGGKRRLASLRQSFPNLVKKETLLPPSELAPFQNHSSQMATLDYIVSLESDIFIPTYKGNMARVIEGHRRYLGFKKTIVLDRRLLVNLIDKYKRGTLSRKRFYVLVKKTHEARDGSPRIRVVIPGNPKEEDNFWSNPQECLLQEKGDASPFV